MPSTEPAPDAESLRDSLEIVLPALSEELAGAEAVAALRGLAAQLPAVHVAGFECRLDIEERVDFQQCVRRIDGGAVVLRRFVERMRAGRGGVVPEAWERLDAFCEEWLSPDSPLHHGVVELWIEFDLKADTRAREALPSVFVTFAVETARTPSQPGLARRALAHLLGEEALEGPTGAALAHMATACSGGTWISNVGVMLGRDLGGARLHISGLPVGSWPEFLDGIGWPGDGEAARRWGEELLSWTDVAVLCFDVGAAVGSRLGIETGYRSRPGGDTRWYPLMGVLVERGLCLAAKVDALASWVGTVEPPSAPAPWPSSALALDLVRDEREFGVFGRRFSHVKVTLDGGAESAKAYFGFGHVAAGPTARQAAQPPVAPRGRASGGQGDAGIELARERATRFLLDHRTQGGWWLDFLDTGIASRPIRHEADEWVTGYVGTALAGSPDPEARTEVAATASLVERRRPDQGGWGYAPTWPADADSTAWVLRMMRRIGHESARTPGTLAFLAEHVDSRGGAGTFATSSIEWLREFISSPGVEFAGWRAGQPCVTAAVAPLMGEKSMRRLLEWQRSDGSWPAYWWAGGAYATGHACETLMEWGGPGAHEAVRAAGRWAVGQVDAEGRVWCPYLGAPAESATALVARALAAALPVAEDRRATAAALGRAANWLTRSQLSDGSFTATSYLLIPATEDVGPVASRDTLITAYLDQHRLFTTATVLGALHAAQAARRDYPELSLWP